MQNWRTTRRALASVGLAGALCSVAPMLAAQTGAAASFDAGRWLARVQSAALNRSYQGTLVFRAGGVVSSSRIVHICDGKERYERIELLDGRVRLQYRHNGQMLTLWPDERLAVAESQDAVAGFPQLPVGGRPLDSYELRAIGNDRIAGHLAEVLMLRPRDGHRFAQRMWTDRETGLLLRSDVLGPGGELLESLTFIDLAMGGKAQAADVLGPMRRLDGYRVVRPTAVRAQLEAEGWAMSRPVPGFQLVNCVKRSLDVTAEDNGADRPVLQAVFSDGLTHVSIFIEPFDPQRHKPMRTALGATHTLMSRRGDSWVTVVGEVPMDTVQQFDALLERRR